MEFICIAKLQSMSFPVIKLELCLIILKLLFSMSECNFFPNGNKIPYESQILT